MNEAVGAKLHKLDFAGRLKLREEERRELGSAVILACGFDHCVNVFPPAAWESFAAGFEQLSPHDPTAHDLRRFLLSTAERCEVDGQGRVRIPDLLLRWAGLGGGKLQAYLIRAGDRWELWEEERYQSFLEESLALKPLQAQYFGGRAPGEESAAA